MKTEGQTHIARNIPGGTIDAGTTTPSDNDKTDSTISRGITVNPGVESYTQNIQTPPPPPLPPRRRSQSVSLADRQTEKTTPDPNHMIGQTNIPDDDTKTQEAADTQSNIPQEQEISKLDVIKSVMKQNRSLISNMAAAIGTIAAIAGAIILASATLSNPVGWALLGIGALMFVGSLISIYAADNPVGGGFEENMEESVKKITDIGEEARNSAAEFDKQIAEINKKIEEAAQKDALSKEKPDDSIHIKTTKEDQHETNNPSLFDNEDE